jgi:hypothetical protein
VRDDTLDAEVAGVEQSGEKLAGQVAGGPAKRLEWVVMVPTQGVGRGQQEGEEAKRLEWVVMVPTPDLGRLRAGHARPSFPPPTA